MREIESKVAADERRDERQPGAATRDMLARKPLTTTHEVPGPEWTIGRRLGRALAALRRGAAATTPTLDNAGQPTA